MTSRQRILGLVAVVAVAAVAVQVLRVRKQSRVVVVRTGDPAPGIAPGARFRDFKDVCLNSSGQVAFWGAVEGPGVTRDDDEGIWISQGASLALVARTGADAPGVSGLHFRSFGGGLVLNDSGQVAFWARMMQPIFDGVWVGGVGNLGLVAQTGQSAPGTEAGVTFNLFDQLRLNAAGQVAFHASLDGQNPNLTEANNDGIWIGTPGNLALAVRQPGPNTEHPILDSEGPTFSDLSLNAAGTLMFRGRLQPVIHDVPGGVEIEHRFGIFVSHRPYGASEFLVHPIPVASRTATFGYLEGPSLSATNNFTFAGEITEQYGPHYTGIWFYDVSSPLSTPWSLIASDGTQNSHPPGTPADTLFESLWHTHVSINDKDEIAFTALIKGPSVTTADNVGLWAGKRSQLSLVTRTGSSAAGVPEATFALLHWWPWSPFITAAGDVVFRAQLAGNGINDDNDWGTWIRRQGSLRLVMREGDKLKTGNAGVMSTFSTVKSYGLPAYSESGRFATLVSFTDGTDGVVVVTP